MYVDPQKCKFERSASSVRVLGPSGHPLFFGNAVSSDSDLLHIIDVINMAYALGWDLGRSRLMRRMNAIIEEEQAEKPRKEMA